ncbi:tape measure protein, partial [Proteus mirabilis]
IAETTTELDGQKESLEAVNKKLRDHREELGRIKQAANKLKEQDGEIGATYTLDSYVDAIRELTKKQQQYELLISEGEQNIRRWTVSQGKAANIAKERAKQTDELSRAELIYQRQAKGIVDANQQLARSLELGSDAAVKKEQAIKELEKALIADGFVKDSELFKQKIQELTDELDKKASLNLANSLAEIEQRTQALTIGMKDGKPALDEYNASLLLMQMGIKKGSATYNTELPKAIEAIRNLREAQEAALNSKSNANKSLKAINKANDAIKKQQQQTETLRKEFELLSSGAANVNREMAIFNAVQSLGADATDKQKKAIAEEAAEVFDLKQKVDDFIKSQEITPELKLARAFRQESEELKRMFDNDFIDEETFKALGNKAMKAFDAGMAEIKINAVIDPITEAKGQYDPVQQLKNEHERKLALIREFETEKGAITQRGLELMNAANTQYEQDRMNAQWEIWRNQSQANQFLADGLDALGQRSTNVLTGLLTQTQSLNDAFRNVALTIVDQAVGALVQMGMQQVKNMVTESAMRKASNAQAIAEATTTGAAITNAMAPAAATTSIATMGSAATWGMAAMATAIPAMIALAGARKNGGPVNAGSMYRVGEGGKPEIFKASNGSQYMIPGDNGRVISNRQMGKGGNGVSMGDMHFTFQVQAPNGITQKEAQQIQQMVRGTVYDVLGNEMRSGGALEKVRSW